MFLVDARGVGPRLPRLGELSLRAAQHVSTTLAAARALPRSPPQLVRHADARAAAAALRLDRRQRQLRGAASSRSSKGCREHRDRPGAASAARGKVSRDSLGLLAERSSTRIAADAAAGALRSIAIACARDGAGATIRARAATTLHDLCATRRRARLDLLARPQDPPDPARTADMAALPRARELRSSAVHQQLRQHAAASSTRCSRGSRSLRRARPPARRSPAADRPDLASSPRRPCASTRFADACARAPGDRTAARAQAPTAGSSDVDERSDAGSRPCSTRSTSQRARGRRARAARDVVAGPTRWSRAMDFRLLYDARSGGCSTSATTSTPTALDPHHYDLLASEARLASFSRSPRATSRSSHWYAARSADHPVARHAGAAVVGRHDVRVPDAAAAARSREGTLLAQSQQRRGRARRSRGPRSTPCRGASPSRATPPRRGPALSVSRFRRARPRASSAGSTRIVVIAPYASALALPFRPRAVVANLAALGELGHAAARYGLYEALDFTPRACPTGDRSRSCARTWRTTRACSSSRSATSCTSG